VSDDTLSFDFIMRSGPSSTRNAIALLKLMHYPERVVATAVSALAAAESATGTVDPASPFHHDPAINLGTPP
jgi:DNA mismatch repair ATPase MutS